MQISRFKEIIKYSHENKAKMESKIKDLYVEIGMEYGSELLNIMQIMRPLLQQKKYIVLELPFCDREIGALCYKGDTFGYTFLNSSLPKVNVNFALCHEIYHIFCQEKEFRNKVELYINEHYYEHEEEFAANLFAGMLLMPEQSYRLMYHKFRKEAGTGDTQFSLIVKLMNYFGVPYMAALIRCYELDLMESGAVLEDLMKADMESIRKEFARLWLDEGILNATGKDDYKKLETMVAFYGVEYQKQEFINERAVEQALRNMRALYSKIKGE